MLEILRFIFSSFWIFCGTVILIIAVAIVVDAMFPITKKEIYYDRDSKDN